MTGSFARVASPPETASALRRAGFSQGHSAPNWELQREEVSIGAST